MSTAKTIQIKPEFKNFFLSPAGSSHSAMLKALKKLESSYQEKELGIEYMIVTQKLHTEGGKPQDILSIGKKALNVLIYDEECEMRCFSNKCDGVMRVLNHDDNVTKSHGKLLLISSILNILGFACSSLKMFDECLRYLTWSSRNLMMLEKDSSTCLSCVLQLLHVSQVRLFDLKMIHLGRRDEAAVHMRKVLEIKEQCLEPGCIELGQANRDVYYAYLEIDDYEQALPHCLKALEIYTEHLGHDDTTMVAVIRRELGGIYNEIGEQDKALEQMKLSQSSFRNTNNISDSLKSDIANAYVLLDLGRDREAFDVLKAVVLNADAEEGLQASALIAMARALLNVGELAEAKKSMEFAYKILEGGGINPADACDGFQNMSILYERIGDLETAISFSRRVLMVPDLPQQLLVDGYERLFLLVSKSGMGIEGIPYLEEAVKILKESLGPKNLDVSYGYAKLGEVYMKLGRPEPAAKYLKLAKGIMDVFLGPHHSDSLKTSQSLDKACADMGSQGRYAQAIECQEKLVESLKALGSSEVDHLAEAVGLLAVMKVKAARAAGESSDNIPSEILESLGRPSP